MEITEQLLDSITIDAPTKDLERLTPYGDFVEVSAKDIKDANVKKECRLVLKEQALATIREIHRLRGEKLVAMLFWEKPPSSLEKRFAPPKPGKVNRGWIIWTDRQC